MSIDLLITHAVVATLDDGRPGPLTGASHGDLHLFADGAVAITSGRVTAVGPRDEVERVVRGAGGAEETLHADGRLISPGLVDPHTHLLYGGSRADEFALRASGTPYLEIMEAGGGIMETVRQTRSASDEELARSLHRRLDRAARLGVTTVEVKTGYGLRTDQELRHLDIIDRVGAEHVVRVVPTFLGAHAIPVDGPGRDAYMDSIVEEMIPAVAARAQPPFCDVFCDRGALTLEEARRVLVAARDAGLPLKAHADEFANLGATRMAASLGATSCDHLMRSGPDDHAALAERGTVGVILPGTTIGLGETHFADGRAMIDRGVPVAIATDWNPGSAPCESLLLVLALATRYCGLTPAEALVAATRNAANAIGLDDRAGRLAAGRPADLVMWDSADYRDRSYRFGDRQAEGVMIAGQWVVRPPRADRAVDRNAGGGPA